MVQVGNHLPSRRQSPGCPSPSTGFKSRAALGVAVHSPVGRLTALWRLSGCQIVVDRRRYMIPGGAWPAAFQHRGILLPREANARCYSCTWYWPATSFPPQPAACQQKLFPTPLQRSLETNDGMWAGPWEWERDGRRYQPKGPYEPSWGLATVIKLLLFHEECEVKTTLRNPQPNPPRRRDWSGRRRRNALDKKS